MVVICDYTSNDKSNFNMLGHRNRTITELVKARGLLRTHEARAVSSKNKDVRVESREIIKTAKKMKAHANRALVALQGKEQGTRCKVAKTVVLKEEKEPPLPLDLDLL